MQPLEGSGAVRPLYWSLGVKGLNRAVTLRGSGAASCRRPGTRISCVLLYHRTA